MGDYANTYDLYSDIKERTGGEIYLGVVGPVRTGKSTFIKRFMEEMVLPNMEEEHAKKRALDEMPQSAGGKTITTTEPKFIPNEAAEVKLKDDIAVSVRLIDCVGYLVEGAAGHMEEDVERMVKTPWFDTEIPFSQAAEIGTDKVMNDHSTIGVVVTSDGSFGEIPRQNFLMAEEKTIRTLKKLGKPFIVIVNSQKPYSEEAKNIADQISSNYNVKAIPISCEQLKKDDILMILEQVLYEFPISCMEFYTPAWMEMLPNGHPIKTDLLEQCRELSKKYDKIRDIYETPISMTSQYIRTCKTDTVLLSNGMVKLVLDLEDRFYYNALTDMVGEEILDEYQLVEKLKALSAMRKEYEKVCDAVKMVRLRGYGVVTPEKNEITLEPPELIKHGNKYGVKIKATSPSIHMIRANIETEIAPIVGTKEQAEDLISYISDNNSTYTMWETNIFGKTVEQLVNEGITAKVAVIGDESQLKLQDTMQKIVNDSNGGMVCIIL